MARDRLARAASIECQAARFWDKVEFARDDGCWVWIGARSSFGHGGFGVLGRMIPAHKWLYEQLRGPVPKGLELDHLCRNPSCVNPAHLEPVTHRENVIRGSAAAVHMARAAAREACKYGHPYSEQNTAIAVGRNGRTFRRCRKCCVRKAKEKRMRRRGIITVGDWIN